jgi:hypothetical protein
MDVTLLALLYWSCNSLFVRILHPFVSLFGPYTLLKIFLSHYTRECNAELCSLSYTQKYVSNLRGNISFSSFPPLFLFLSALLSDFIWFLICGCLFFSFHLFLIVLLCALF